MLYRWPQGRVVRTLLLVLTALITVDLGWGGAWSQYAAFAESGESVTPLIYAVILGVLAAAVFFSGIVLIGFAPKSAQFLIEVEQEMAKVIWPSRSELIRSTIMIAVIAILLSIILFIVDAFNGWLTYDVLFKIGGG